MSDHAGARVRFQAPRLRNANFATFSLQTAITKEEPMKNFLRLDGRSILSVPYMYIDHKDYLADPCSHRTMFPCGSEVNSHGTIPRTTSLSAKSERKIRRNLRNPWNCCATRCFFSDTTITWNSAITSWKHWDRIEVPHEEIICSDQQTE